MAPERFGALSLAIAHMLTIQRIKHRRGTGWARRVARHRTKIQKLLNRLSLGGM